MVLLALLPIAWPADQDGVVLEAAQPTGLDQVRGGVTQVGGDHHLAEALHLLALHQLLHRLQSKRQVLPKKFGKQKKA